MEKGILTCGVGKDYEFDCTLNGKKIEIHRIQLENGMLSHVGKTIISKEYREEGTRQKAMQRREEARTYREKKGKKVVRPATEEFSSGKTKATTKRAGLFGGKIKTKTTGTSKTVSY